MSHEPFRTILGIRFFTGEVKEALAIAYGGGLVVVPSGPNLADIPGDPDYYRAVANADLVITDSGAMVIAWKWVKAERVPRLSGLKFLVHLLEDETFKQSNDTFWIMPTVEDSLVNRNWLGERGLRVTESECYVAPFYKRSQVEDPDLLEIIRAQRPQYIMINIAGGVQEKLGDYLKRGLDYRPTIICTGAAIAFLTGRQATIPTWADRLMLGWLLRCLRSPRQFVPRYWKARRLFGMVLKYREKSPL